MSRSKIFFKNCSELITPSRKVVTPVGTGEGWDWDDRSGELREYWKYSIS